MSETSSRSAPIKGIKAEDEKMGGSAPLTGTTHLSRRLASPRTEQAADQPCDAVFLARFSAMNCFARRSSC